MLRRHPAFGATLMLFVGALAVPALLLLQLYSRMSAAESSNRSAARFNTIDPLYTATDPASLISIRSESDAAAKRQELIDFIWRGKGFPSTKAPGQVETGISDSRYSDLEDLAGIDKLTITMPYGIDSVVYYFHPAQDNRRLVIYHEGHDGDFVLRKDAIKAFVKGGYSVLALSMPLVGMNNRPMIDIPRVGKLKLTLHDQLKFFEAPDFSSISLFMEPVAVALNYVEKQANPGAVYMVGLSGGGWTTVLYSAIDPRISKSYPVAGSLPIHLRADPSVDWGDYEQTLPDLYRITTYLELYILGSWGPERSQVQVMNKYDPCCFAGIRHETYEATVKEAVERLGQGAFRVYLDDTAKEHNISQTTLQAILSDMQGR